MPFNNSYTVIVLLNLKGCILLLVSIDNGVIFLLQLYYIIYYIIYYFYDLIVSRDLAIVAEKNKYLRIQELV